MKSDRLGAAGGVLAVLVILAWLVGRTGPDRGWAAADAAWVLLTSGPAAAVWMLAAAGFGWPMRRLLVPQISGASGLAVQSGLGVAALLVLDESLGALGLFQVGGAAGAWLVLAAGTVLAVEQFRRARRAAPWRPAAPHWLVWSAAPAIAVLLAASCSAPGWLWSSEFGGYDALEYHLQLPAEWLAGGRLAPLAHNVYSYLPGYVEAAYYHLAVVIGDGLAASYACQLLHASITLLAAAVTGRLAAVVAGRAAGAVAAVAVLGTPWAVVVGSLAYNEMAVALLLATGLLLIAEGAGATWRGAAAVGALAGAACGAKLTAAGFAALPLLAVLLAAAPPRRWRQSAPIAVAAAIIALFPYLLRNAVYAGNPVFPFLAGLLGDAHWTPQQARIWIEAHLAGGGPAARLLGAWDQLLRYGIGPSPDPSEPWKPQWSILPWLSAAGLAAAALAGTPAQRRWALRLGLVLAVQVVFWIALTHVRSRFMLPAVVPAAAAVGIGLAAAARRAGDAALTAPGAAALFVTGVLWCALPVGVYLGERGRAPAAMVGWAGALTGDALAPQQQSRLGRTSPVVYLNHLIEPGSRILLIGEATPFYYRADVAYQTTWDRGPISLAMARDPEGWLDELRRQGFTHLLVNARMLDLWEEEGWNDPRITAEAIVDAADRGATLERDFGAGIRLYRLD